MNQLEPPPYSPSTFDFDPFATATASNNLGSSSIANDLDDFFGGGGASKPANSTSSTPTSPPDQSATSPASVCRRSRSFCSILFLKTRFYADIRWFKGLITPFNGNFEFSRHSTHIRVIKTKQVVGLQTQIGRLMMTTRTGLVMRSQRPRPKQAGATPCSEPTAQRLIPPLWIRYRPLGRLENQSGRNAWHPSGLLKFYLIFFVKS